MLQKFQNYISTIGLSENAGHGGQLKVKTLNWILFWTILASVFWTIMLFILKQYKAVPFPLIATILILFSLVRFAKTKNFQATLNTFIVLLLFLPPIVQLFHGGFINSGAVVVWAVLAPVSSLIFKPIRTAQLIFAAFLLLTALTAVAELSISVEYQKVSYEIIIIQFLLNIIAVLTICYFPILHFTNEMMKARRIIKLQNDKIVSSIEYAKYIQKAILASKEDLDLSLNKDYFLYFEPKDIVSGDFYWVNQKNGKLIIICGDCTGHGVPGAIMTMMGINHLNNIIKEKGITDPSMILLFLHTAVIESLKHSTEKINDGMDIAVCTIDLEKNYMEYAGAKSRMYYFNGSLKTYQPTKISIGDNSRNVSFQKHRIDIKKGDCFYLLTDGYIDQFGGPHEKRYGSKRLFKLIANLYKKDIQEQGEIIKREMKRWKGIEEQIDDITFMGFKI